VLDKIRALVDRYENRFVFGEFSEEPGLLGHFAGATHGLHTGYTFTFLEDRTFKPDVFAKHYAFLDGIAGLWPCVTFSNHDVPRTVTRYGRTMAGDPALAKLTLTLLMTLKGTVLLYQGEELGLPDGPIERQQIRDPVGELYFPYSKGRDPCRTPMPWVAAKPNLGFSYGEPWLPVAPAHAALAAATQERDQASVLWFARQLTALRKAHPVLALGEMKVLSATDQVLAFERSRGADHIVCVFNLSNSDASFALSGSVQPVLDVGNVARHGDTLTLSSRSAWLGKRSQG
jgi:alpha-glucosidase